MSQTITITNEDIVQQIKISYKITEVIDQIITRKVITNAAEELGIKVEPEELQNVADQIRIANKLLSADETWIWLEKHSLSLDDFEEIVYNGAIFAKLSQHLFLSQIEPYFFEHQLEYVGVVMYEFILDDEDLALELFYAIQEGEVSFYEVAPKYIQDPELRRKFGYQGVLHRKNLKPEISSAVFAAKPPQVLKPIVTSKGIHLILVEEIIQPELNETLRYQILSDLSAAYLKENLGKFEVVNKINVNSAGEKG
jgi:parvulin-like peptidyl-prolyl isomerase